jgi:signal transduction histidine kinase
MIEVPMATNEKNPSSTTSAEATPTSERPLVWILDDSPMEAAIARRALAAQYEIRTFEDGSILLERIATGPSPNVLVLDWQLPGMSGIEVCRFLRSGRDEMELPILMLTVYGHKGDLVEGLGAGANDYLTKPYDAPELAARVATLVRINQLYERARRADRRCADLLKGARLARADAETANRAKDEFLAMVSHELRTPLNAILGWTRMVRSGSIAPAQIDKALSTVERNALAQTQLIDDLMDMSRILSGKLTIEHEPVELVNLIQASVDAVRPSAENKKILISLRIDPDAGRISGDAARLQQGLLNLLTNAIKFTPKGGNVMVALSRVDAEVQLSVADSGTGIAPEFLPHVFERFRLGDIGAKRFQAGLGLGLAIVKHIVELHGGSVEARSDGVGRGATFLLTLPRARRLLGINTPMSDFPARLSEVMGSGRLVGLRVLVVDDDADAAELLAAMLQRQGAEVVSARSALEALAVIAERRPDVLVSDVAMPDRDGHDLIRSVRVLPAQDGGRIPSLALTAFARPEDRTTALAAGFNMYASKPVNPTELVISVATLAGRFEG